MNKYILSNKGNTLILVLGVAIVITLLAIPLVNMMNTGYLQAQTDIRKEQAREYAESGVRIMRSLLKLTADPKNTPEQNRTLVEQLAGQVHIPGTVLQPYPATGEPQGVNIISDSGTGSLKRSKTTPLIILRFPKSGGTGGGQPGPTENSTGNEFYFTHAVTVNSSKLNRFFKACGNSEQPSQQFYDNTVIDENQEHKSRFNEEFALYIDYYLGDKFTTRMNERPLPRQPIPVSKEVDDIVNGTWPFGDNVTQTYNNDIKVSTNIQQTGINNLVINGNVWTKGNATFNGNTSKLRINGDLIVKGDLVINGGSTIEITGNLIIGGSLQTNSHIETFLVGKNLSVGNNLTYNSGATIRVGQWNTGNNQIISSDHSSIIVKNKLTFSNSVTNLFVTGDFSSGSYSTKQIATVHIGGSYITAGNADFPSSMQNWNIGGHISVGGTLTTGSLKTLNVGKNIYAVQGLTFANDIQSLHVYGSVLTYGTIKFSAIINSAIIDGDLISKTKIDFVVLGLLRIGGSVVSSGDIIYPNTISKVYIDGDLLTVSNMSFQSINEHFEVGGIMGALNNIQFANNIHNSINQLGGFYVGGTTTFPNWYNDNENRSGTICIVYKEKSSGSGSGIGIEFGS